MLLDQRDAQTRQRLPAPAGRWATAVRAVADLDRHAKLLSHPVEDGRCRRDRKRLGSDIGLPRESSDQPPLIRVAAQLRSAFAPITSASSRDSGDRRPGPAAEQHAIAPDNQRAIRE